MNVLLPGVAALVAVLIVPGWSFYFDVVPKVVILLAGAALALWLWPRQARSTSLTWFFAMLAAQALAILLATIFSTHPWFSIYGSTWRRSGAPAELAVLVLAAATAAMLAGDRANLRLWLRITVLAAVPISIYAIMQYFGIDPILATSAYHFGEGKYMIVRPPGTLGHASYLATYLLYAAFGGGALARMEVGRLWKTAALGSAGLALFAMVLSGTRAALLGLVAGALFIAVREHLDRRWLVAAAGIVMVVAAFYISPAGARLRARVFWSSEDMLGGSRLLLWRDTLRMSASRWLTGYGPESFSLEFPRHESIELARQYPDFYHESPHNVFLDALVSKGLLGLAALIGVSIFGIATARGAVGGAFVAILISQQFTAFIIPTELYFYLCIAMLVSNTKPLPSLRKLPIAMGRVLAVPFACFAIFLTTGDLLLGSARRALDRGDVESAAQLVDRAGDWHASADFYFSRRFLQEKAAAPAMQAAVNAAKTADDPQNALVNLAAFRATVDDAAGVEKNLRDAVSAAPNWYKPHWLLAQVLEKEGRMTEAAAEAQAAFNRDGGKNPEVTATRDRLSSR